MGQRTHYDKGPEATGDNTEAFSGFWGDCRTLDREDMHHEVYGYTEDFMSFIPLTATGLQANGSGMYHCFIENSATIIQTTARAGKIAIASGASNDDEVILQAMQNLTAGGGPFQISTTAADNRTLWFETTIDVSRIDGTESAFIGLCENFVPGAGDVLVDATNVPKSTTSLIGFLIPEADTTTFDFIYQETGQALQTINNGIGTLAVTTKIRLGFKYEPSADTSRRITVYVNGVPQASFVTGANIAADTFPDGVPMVPTWNLRTNTGTAYTMNVYNWACWQKY